MTPSRNRPDALPSRSDVAAWDNKDTALPSKSTPTKRTPSKQETTNVNCLSNNKDKNQLPEALSWASLPANLSKSGKVPYLLSSTFLLFVNDHCIFEKFDVLCISTTNSAIQ